MPRSNSKSPKKTTRAKALPPPPESAVPLRLSGLRKRYGKFEVLKGLNLALREGEIYGFLGRNGAGKTTTLQILMGILKSDGGSLELFGRKARGPSIADKRKIGYVSQEQFFFPWMSCAQLGRFVSGFYPSWDQALFDSLLSRFDLPAARKVRELSGGMRAKLALALALAHHPPLLLLDEPTAGLDPAARREFLELVKRESQGRSQAALFSTHLVDDLLRVADRVGMLEGGVLVDEGVPAQLEAGARRATWVRRGPKAADAVLADLKALAGRKGLALAGATGQPLSWVLRGAPSALGKLKAPAWAFAPIGLEDLFLAQTVHRVS